MTGVILQQLQYSLHAAKVLFPDVSCLAAEDDDKEVLDVVLNCADDETWNTISDEGV